MKHHQYLKVLDINTYCVISNQTQFNADVVKRIEGNKVILLQQKTKRIRNDKELDQALKETFPASDAIAKY